MALMLAICSAQPNWMPRKPKLMFQICQKLRCGLWSAPSAAPLMTGLLDEQDLPLVGTEGERQPPRRAQRAERLLLEEVGDRRRRAARS